MKRTDPAAQVRKARIQLEVAERELVESSRPWARRLRRHREAITLAGGFTSGLALVVLPARWWARAGAVAGRAAAGAARSVLTPMLLGAALAWLRPNPPASSSVASEKKDL
ncbi:MAG: hypothetical protein ABI304_02725 [Rudaea sp.]